MSKLISFEEQVRASLPKVEASSEFNGNDLWLTFYLSGQPENLWRLSKALEAAGWVNVDGWESAFLYPKVQIKKSVDDVLRAAGATHELCARYDIEILNIDADTSADVKRSHFVTLYRS
jgi:hypothetical protein